MREGKYGVVLAAALVAALAATPAAAAGKEGGGVRAGNVGGGATVQSGAANRGGAAISPSGGQGTVRSFRGSTGAAVNTGGQTRFAASGRNWNGSGSWNGHRGRHWGGRGFGAGLAAGAVIGSAPYWGGYPYGYDDYAYDDYAYGDPDAVYAAAPEYGGGGDVEYCMRRFRSYDPQSGTYLGYDGERHPCP